MSKTRKGSQATVLPLDPEIERTTKALRKKKQTKDKVDMAEQRVVENEPVYNPVVLADDRDHAIRQYAVPMFNELNPSIVRPEITAAQFELKPVMFQMLQTG